jgi:hypothetical protein
MRTDRLIYGRTDRYEKLIVAFRNYSKTPKTTLVNFKCESVNITHYSAQRPPVLCYLPVDDKVFSVGFIKGTGIGSGTAPLILNYSTRLDVRSASRPTGLSPRK